MIHIMQRLQSNAPSKPQSSNAQPSKAQSSNAQPNLPPKQTTAVRPSEPIVLTPRPQTVSTPAQFVLRQPERDVIEPHHPIQPANHSVKLAQAIEPLPVPGENEPRMLFDASEVCGDCEPDLDVSSPCEDCDKPRPESGDSSEQDSILKAEPEPLEPPKQPDAPRRRDLQLRPIQHIDFQSALRGLEKLPDEFQRQQSRHPANRDPYYGSPDLIDHHWTARNLAHRTLYFDDLPLERYGFASNPTKQAFCSAAEFLKDAVLFPLRRHRDDCCELHYVLAYDRAGTCTPQIEEKCIPPRTKPSALSRLIHH